MPAAPKPNPFAKFAKGKPAPEGEMPAFPKPAKKAKAKKKK
jgi:hypothetical protein